MLLLLNVDDSAEGKAHYTVVFVNVKKIKVLSFQKKKYVIYLFSTGNFNSENVDVMLYLLYLGVQLSYNKTFSMALKNQAYRAMTSPLRIVKAITSCRCIVGFI